jgi:hypothetical protein
MINKSEGLRLIKSPVLLLFVVIALVALVAYSIFVRLCLIVSHYYDFFPRFSPPCLKIDRVNNVCLLD